jgi:uncharacterized protein YijF (DUF1287 family)
MNTSFYLLLILTRTVSINKMIIRLPIIFLLIFNLAYSQVKDTLSVSALKLTEQEVTYTPGYFSIDYPNGDIPGDKGVCTDVIIRAYRLIGIDLQKDVHEDMKANFDKYPKNWGLKKPDKNIDHRRVPNLMTLFERKGTVKSITNKPEDYLPGDIVCWDLGGGVTHIGIVVHIKSDDGLRNLIVHNIGAGQVIEDCLFDFKIIGHYRYKN